MFLCPTVCFRFLSHVMEGDLLRGHSIERCVQLSLAAVAEGINKRRRQHCFELYGYDFMVDTDFKVPQHQRRELLGRLPSSKHNECVCACIRCGWWR